MCSHIWQEQEKRVQPIKHVSFRIRYNVCVECGEIIATEVQRKKNRKQANYAHNKYKRMQRGEQC